MKLYIEYIYKQSKIVWTKNIFFIYRVNLFSLCFELLKEHLEDIEAYIFSRVCAEVHDIKIWCIFPES